MNMRRGGRTRGRHRRRRTVLRRRKRRRWVRSRCLSRWFEYGPERLLVPIFVGIVVVVIKPASHQGTSQPPTADADGLNSEIINPPVVDHRERRTPSPSLAPVGLSTARGIARVRKSLCRYPIHVRAADCDCDPESPLIPLPLLTAADRRCLHQCVCIAVVYLNAALLTALDLPALAGEPAVPAAGRDRCGSPRAPQVGVVATIGRGREPIGQCDVALSASTRG